MITQISPKYDSNYLRDNSTEKKIDVLEDRVNGWFLDWAVELNNKPHAGFSVLHLAFSYFEFIAIFFNGVDSHSKSKQYFKQGFLSVFPNLKNEPYEAVDDFLDLIYKNARCGFFHSGMARKGIILKDQENTILFQNGNIYIDRYKFVNAIKTHFQNYIDDLRKDKDEYLSNFLKAWKLVNS